jgi:hypothetical protein
VYQQPHAMIDQQYLQVKAIHDGNISCCHHNERSSSRHVNGPVELAVWALACLLTCLVILFLPFRCTYICNIQPINGHIQICIIIHGTKPLIKDGWTEQCKVACMGRTTNGTNQMCWTSSNHQQCHYNLSPGCSYSPLADSPTPSFASFTNVTLLVCSQCFGCCLTFTTSK